MNTVRPYRVLIFDDDEAIRKLLWRYFDRRGYEVFTFPHPKSCALCDSLTCSCPTQEACADMIISDLNMPFMQGLDFLELQMKKGCKCKHLALMSGELTTTDVDRAQPLHITLFEKPFNISDIAAWVRIAEAETPPGQSLSNWFLEGKR